MTKTRMHRVTYAIFSRSGRWYYCPDDYRYDGDVTWSRAYDSRRQAKAAAEAEWAENVANELEIVGVADES